MKKVRVFILFCIILLFFGCEYFDKTSQHNAKNSGDKKTSLTIQNQSSCLITDVVFAGKKFEANKQNNVGTPPIPGEMDEGFLPDSRSNKWLNRGEKFEIEFDKENSSYVFFSILMLKNNTRIQVRSSQVVVVRKNESGVFNITDNTLVYRIGSNQRATILEIVNSMKEPTRIEFSNESSLPLLDVRYANCDFGDLHPGMRGMEYVRKVGASKVSFKIQKGNRRIALTTNESFLAKENEITTIAINDETIVNGENKTYRLKEFLGHATLTIVNETDYEITNVCFNDKQCYRIAPHSSEKFTFNNLRGMVQNVLIFDLNKKGKKIALETEKVKVEEDAELRISINDQIMVRKREDSSQDYVTLESLLENTGLKIFNYTSVTLFNIKFNGATCLKLKPNSEGRCSDVEMLPDSISFEIDMLNERITLKTKNPVSFTTREYIITDRTPLLYEDKEVQIRDLLKKCSLEVVNETSIAKIKKLSYERENNIKGIAQGEKWKVVFDDKQEGFLHFTLDKKGYGFDVNVMLEEKISIKSGENKRIVLKDTTKVMHSLVEKTIAQAYGVCFLIVKNESCRDVKLEKDLDYIGIKKGEEKKIEFKNSFNDHLKFDVIKDNITSVKVRSAERIELEGGSEKTFVLKDETEVTDYVSLDKKTLREALGLGVLHFVNQTNKKIKYIAYKNHEYRHSLENGGVWEVELDCKHGNVTDEMEVIINVHGETYYRITIKEQIEVRRGEKKVFTFTEFTEVVHEGRVCRISELT